MPDTDLPSSGHGLSWVLADGRDLITKTLAPSFVFVDLETYVNTNVCQRLRKRSIAAYVSVSAPTMLLASLYGHTRAIEMLCSEKEDVAVKRAVDYVCQAFESASAAGADALIICDDLCGVASPIVDPLKVMECIIPGYAAFTAKAAELELPLVFHSMGDIRDYYAALASEGFAGVHVSHPVPETVSEMFTAAREAGLVPLGGLIGTRVEDGAESLAGYARGLEESGPALICDDGTIKDLDGLKVVTDALAILR